MVAIERFFYFLDNQGLKHTPVEKQLGLSNGYLGKMKARKASIGSDMIERIVSYFPNLNTEWLISGTGEMLKDKSTYITGNKGVTNTGHVGGNIISESQVDYKKKTKNLEPEVEKLKILLIEKDAEINTLKGELKAKNDIIEMFLKK